MRLSTHATTGSYTGSYDTRVLCAFEHSHEHAELTSAGPEPRFLPCLLELAETLWLAPDDITGALLIELLHDAPRVRDYQRHEIPAMVDELGAFFAFAARECKYPHAGDCLRVLERDAALALECALESARRELRVTSPVAGQHTGQHTRQPMRWWSLWRSR